MRSGLTKRGTRVVQQMATAQMLQTCVVEKVTAPSVNTDLTATSGSRTTIYSGPCRIWQQKMPALLQVGEAEFVVYQTILSVPWNANGGSSIAKHHEVQILTDPSDPIRTSERYRIQSLQQGGQILATRSFVLERLEPRP